MKKLLFLTKAMVKINFTFRLVSILLFLTCFYSCGKEYGCTSYGAENYDISANRQDGSCVYKATAAIKWTNPFIYFIDANLTTISIYIDNVAVAKDVNVFLYEATEPLECNSTYWFSFEKYFLLKNGPGSDGGVYRTHLDVYNHNDSLIYSMKTDLIGKPECNLIEFTLP